MNWQDIPSLSALRAFEAAARLASYSAAARELNVSHAAIAQHVRALEDFFARSLMQREGKGMGLTEDGALLAQALSAGFSTIAEGVTSLTQQGQERSLRIATTPSFAENWLVPRLGKFWEAHPEIGLEIVPGSKTVNLLRDGFDMALRYGRGGWPDGDSEPLVSAAYVVVAAPGLLPKDRIDGLHDLKHLRWFQVGARTEDVYWFHDHGLDPETLNISLFETGTLAMQAVRSGIGVSSQPAAVVAADIEAGRLVALYKETDSPFHYHIVLPKGRLTEKARLVRRWLRAQV